jgi:hypothetical protein
MGEENWGDFVSRDVEEVGDVLGSGVGVTEDVFSLGENLRDVVAKIGCEGRTTSGKTQGD